MAIGHRDQQEMNPGPEVVVIKMKRSVMTFGSQMQMRNHFGVIWLMKMVEPKVGVKPKENPKRIVGAKVVVKSVGEILGKELVQSLNLLNVLDFG